MLGHDVRRVNLSDRRWGTFVWVAPDLGCLELRRSAKAPGGAHNEFEVTELQLGDPSDALFQTPGDYVERSPADIEREFEAKYPGRTHFGKSLDMIEKRYRDHQMGR